MCAEQFSECSNFDLYTIALFLLFSLSHLEVLSTIMEIRGPLRIQGWQGETFSYLRNLRRIGHTNGTTLNRVCSGTECEFTPTEPVLIALLFIVDNFLSSNSVLW